MRRYALAAVLLLALSVPGLAGEIQIPGKSEPPPPPPPPCTENCTNSAMSYDDPASVFDQFLIEILIDLIAVS